MSLTGLVAVVTGATGSIGGALARHLSQRGAHVCLLGRQADLLRRTAENLSGESSGYAVDLTREDQILTTAEAIVKDHSRVDILMHCAGAFYMGDLAGADIALLDRQYLVNFRAPYLLTQKLLGPLIHNSGQIVFINSTVGLRGKAGLAQYSATKHALKGFADSLRDEVNRKGVRVVSVFPGRTRSDMQKRIHEDEAREYDVDKLMAPEDVSSMVMCALELPRSAEVTDIGIRPMQVLS